jgi:hypothetical protein
VEKSAEGEAVSEAVSESSSHRRGRSWIVTDPRLRAFNAWAQRHYGNQEALADAVMTNRAHLSQVLHGRRRGKHTWTRLVKVLPAPGLLLLQQCPAWNKDAAEALKQRREREQFAERFGDKTKEQ